MATQFYEATPDASRFLSLQEAVQLGYGSYQTFRRYIVLNKLPAAKIGGRVKVLRAYLDALAVPVGRDPLDQHIKALVDGARRLNDEQVARLRSAFGGGRR